MFTTKDAALLMSSFSVYKGILHRTVPNAFYRLLCAYDAPPVEFARAWGEFFALLCDRGYSGNLSRCLSETALFDENAFSKAAAAGKADQLAAPVKRLSNAILRLSSRSALLPPSTCWTATAAWTSLDVWRRPFPSGRRALLLTS